MSIRSASHLMLTTLRPTCFVLFNSLRRDPVALSRSEKDSQTLSLDQFATSVLLYRILRLHGGVCLSAGSTSVRYGTKCLLWRGTEGSHRGSTPFAEIT